MKLFADPTATTCRPVTLFLAEHDLPVEIVPVSLMEGEHLEPHYAALNPNKAVPTLVDGNFALTEGSAILKHLADVVTSPAYPCDLKARSRVNQAMDWLNTGFYRDFGYGLVYPQVFAHVAFANPGTQADVLRISLERSHGWLRILNDHWLAGSPYLCGDEASLADFMGAAYVSIGDWIGFELTGYSNVARWMRTMRSRPSWAATHRAWNAMTAMLRSQLAKSA